MTRKKILFSSNAFLLLIALIQHRAFETSAIKIVHVLAYLRRIRSGFFVVSLGAFIRFLVEHDKIPIHSSKLYRVAVFLLLLLLLFLFAHSPA